MMMLSAVLASALLIVSPLAPLFAAETNSALERPVTLGQPVQKYDPRAVSAAQHYLESPAMKAGMTAIMTNINKTLSDQFTRQNSKVASAELEQMKKILDESPSEFLDLILPLNMITVLDTFTTDELVAMDNFYSSSVGEAIMAKMPQLSLRLPAMIQEVMPKYLAVVQARIKAEGLEAQL